MLAAIAQSRRAAITWRCASGELVFHRHARVQATFNTVSGPQNCSMCAITQLGSAPPCGIGIGADGVGRDRGFRFFISQESPLTSTCESDVNICYSLIQPMLFVDTAARHSRVYLAPIYYILRHTRPCSRCSMYKSSPARRPAPQQRALPPCPL